jgi:prephenate dehydrogenase
LGLALKACNPSVQIYGYSRSIDSSNKAKSIGAIDQYFADIKDLARFSDLIFICTPISAVIPVLCDLIKDIRPGTIITDVASVKADIVQQAQQLMPKNSYFIGSHPMAGSDKNGIDHARADLFDQAVWAVTPTKETRTSAKETLHNFLRILPVRVVELDASLHDQVVAGISHLPYLAACLLVEQVMDKPLDMQHRLLEFAASGFRDTTRVAGSVANWGVDICLSNKAALLNSIEDWQKRMESLKELINEHNGHKMMEYFEKISKFRQDMD